MTTPLTPQEAISTAELRTVVEIACRAPSLHNSQPWRWVFENGVLHLHAHHGRVGHHTDITGNEVLLSCGAALNHLSVAAAAAGWQTSVDRFPTPRNHDHLAAIAFRRTADVSAHDRELREAILRRRTDRLPFAAPEPWSGTQRELSLICHHFAVDMDVIDDSGRPALADASRQNEQHRRDDASYRYELLWWTHHRDSSVGIPPAALTSTAEAPRVDVARDFPAYTSGDRAPRVERDRSKILVLSTFDDSRPNVLSCGEALSRVLLACTAAGLATCPLTHMMELHSGREAVRRLTGRHAQPQVLVRVGRSVDDVSPAANTQRRPISDTLEVL